MTTKVECEWPQVYSRKPDVFLDLVEQVTLGILGGCVA